MEYLLHLCILICIYLIIAQGFNIILGLGNLFNLAHIALYSIGAYCTALGARDFNLSLWQTLLISSLAAGLCALIVGAISARLKNDYFAIGSLALASMITALEINLKNITNGVRGISGIPRPQIFGHELSEQFDFFILCASLCVCCLVATYFFWKSPFVRRLKAQSECEEAAYAVGINAGQARNFAFFLGSLYAGLAGGLFAYFISYIDPSSFALSEMVLILTIVVVGRPGSFWGVCFSTVFFILIPEALRFVEIPSDILGPARQVLFAAILYVVVYYNRQRIFPERREV